MKSLAQARIKRARAVELVAEGKTYEEVARAVGFTNRGSAHRAVYKALNEREAEGVEILRAIELDRLDRLQVSLWDRALSGDAVAVNAVLRIIEARARLLGLSAQGQRPMKNHELMPLVVGPREGNAGQATDG